MMICQFFYFPFNVIKIGEITECNGESKAIAKGVWTDPYGSRRMKLPEFLDNRHMNVARLSALPNGTFVPQEILLMFISVGGLESLSEEK